MNSMLHIATERCGGFWDIHKLHRRIRRSLKSFWLCKLFRDFRILFLTVLVILFVRDILVDSDVDLPLRCTQGSLDFQFGTLYATVSSNAHKSFDIQSYMTSDCSQSNQPMTLLLGSHATNDMPAKPEDRESNNNISPTYQSINQSEKYLTCPE